MADNRKIISIFLASPGDLEAERRAAKQVVDEFNKQWAKYLGYHVELVGWEDTVAGFGRPQELINRDLQRCEYFIGMIYRRWGTPPNVEGPFTSGFEEEFEISIRNKKEMDKPEISLLFKDIEPEFLLDPGEDLKKVQTFRDKIVSGKEVYYQTFATIRELEAKIRDCITSYVQKLQAEEERRLSDKPQVGFSDSAITQNVGGSDDPVQPLLSAEGTAFARVFVDKTERNSKDDPIEAAEVARFRLLGSVVQAAGNDERTLGVHDANLLYVSRASLDLGYREKIGLVDAALEHQTSETAPLWGWYVDINGDQRGLLAWTSIIGTQSQRVGAITAMRIVAEPLLADGSITRSDFVTHWFSDGAKAPVRAAALGYLGDFGNSSDLIQLRREFDRRDYQTSAAATEAIIRVNLRESREKAIRTLYELQPESVDAGLVSEIFSNGAAIETALLVDGLGHQSPSVRRKAIEILSARSELDADAAEKLLADTDPEVRFEALRFLYGKGKLITDEEAKRILVKPTSSGLFGIARSDSAGEAQYKRFKEFKLHSMTDSELEKEISSATLLDWNARFVFAERHFSTEAPALRHALRDEFKSELERGINDMVSGLGSSANDMAARVRSIEKPLRKEHARSALDVLCRKGRSEDLTLVRQTLKSGFVDFSDLDVEYLGKVGEWDDVPIIISAIQRPASGLSLLSFHEDTTYRKAAKAIHRLAKSRLADVLALEMPPRLLSRLVIESTDKEFRALRDENILNLLDSKDDRVRKTTALKCIRTLPKARLKKILRDYITPDRYRYYNVVYWLDFGVSLPKERIVPAAERMIAKL